MANESKRFFPKISIVSWWKLRERFIQRAPSELTLSYVVNALGMSEASARANVVSPFKNIGLVDAEGKPTDLAYEWRDDSKYPEVCQKLIKRLYPQELLDLYSAPDSSPTDIQNWFMTYARVGAPAGKMYATFYLLLLRADPNETKEVLSKDLEITPKKKKIKSTDLKQQKDIGVQQPQPLRQDLPPATPLGTSPGVNVLASPALHIEIQIHISPDTTPEQIDKIFASMAKHLKDFNKQG